MSPTRSTWIARFSYTLVRPCPSHLGTSRVDSQRLPTASSISALLRNAIGTSSAEPYPSPYRLASRCIPVCSPSAVSISPAVTFESAFMARESGEVRRRTSSLCTIVKRSRPSPMLLAAAASLARRPLPSGATTLRGIERRRFNRLSEDNAGLFSSDLQRVRLRSGRAGRRSNIPQGGMPRPARTPLPLACPPTVEIAGLATAWPDCEGLYR